MSIDYVKIYETVEQIMKKHGLEIVTSDRLAVLEKDHRAMERLRNSRKQGAGVSYNQLMPEKAWVFEAGYDEPSEIKLFARNDPADAILAEGE